jgi:hypothetical protein
MQLFNIGAFQGALSIKFNNQSPCFCPKEIYDSLNCKELNYAAFEMAYNGYSYLKKEKLIDNTRFLTIVDFSKPITEQRFFVIDLENREVIFKELVAHAAKSGEIYAKSFSNEVESEKNSIGFYATGRAYWSKTGYSLKLLGLENGFNDNAFARGIALHGAKKIHPQKSKGCLVVLEDVVNQVVGVVENGACLFVYYPDENYLKESIFLNKTN